MALIVFPTSVVIPNTVPTNGNTVPISGTQGITNHAQLLTYAALSYENINNGNTINFAGITGVLPVCRNTVVASQVDGQLYLQSVSYVKLNNNYASFPNGGKLWAQVSDLLPNQAADSGFNF